jgi:hypothetical protein
MSEYGAYAIKLRTGSKAENHNRLEINTPVYSVRCKLQPSNEAGKWLVKWRWDAISGADAFDFRPCGHSSAGDCDTCPLVNKHLAPGGILYKSADDFDVLLQQSLENLLRINGDRLGANGKAALETAIKKITAAIEYNKRQGEHHPESNFPIDNH